MGYNTGTALAVFIKMHQNAGAAKRGFSDTRDTMGDVLMQSRRLTNFRACDNYHTSTRFWGENMRKKI